METSAQYKIGRDSVKEFRQFIALAYIILTATTSWFFHTSLIFYYFVYILLHSVIYDNWSVFIWPYIKI